MPHFFKVLAGSVTALTCLNLTLSAKAATINNGGFEAGLNGWTVETQPGAAGNWFPTGGGTATLGGQPILDPSEGSGYAHTTQLDPTSQVLFQDISLEADLEHVLSFDWYTQDWAGSFADAGNLDWTAFPNQHFRVDLVSTDFDDWFGPDSSSGVLANILAPVAEAAPATDWNSLTFDLTPWAGESVRLAFRQVDNRNFFNAGVDNVSIDSNPVDTASVPEPSVVSAMVAISLLLVSSRTVLGSAVSSSEG